MAEPKYKAPEGTHDVLPDEARRWRRLEDAARSAFERYGYEEIRTPILEYTQLFHKATGEVTDIVEKEMFTIEAWADLTRRLEIILGTSVKPEAAGTGEQELSDLAIEQQLDPVIPALALLEAAAKRGDRNGGALLGRLMGDSWTDLKEYWSSLSDTQKQACQTLFDDYLKEPRETLSLRPELTPGAIRAVIEANLLSKRSFWKLWYFGPAFRKERPQKGRFRQFTQLGVEAVGASDPYVDAETMVLFADILSGVGVKEWELRINSIGCNVCRPQYREVLRAAVEPLLPLLCNNCNRRYQRNVFRVLDCKIDVEKTANLPPAIAHTCSTCRAHHAAVENALREAGLTERYRVDPRIVRGLDYYTRTVYEFSSSALGAQNAIAGGGRYDTLVRDMGGPDVGSVGFAAGAERILLAMGGDEAPRPLDFFGVAISEAERPAVFKAVTQLRRAGLSGDMDFEGRSVKAQMRSANRSGARYALLVGPEEAAQAKVKLKDMANKEGERLVTVEEARQILSQGGKR